jgi:molecular chaperone DnaK (HSP70)
MKKSGFAHRFSCIAFLMLFLALPSAKAAENRQGVIQMIAMSLESAKSALESDRTGNKPQALNSLKQTEQYIKQYTDSVPAAKIKKLKSSITQAKDYMQNSQMDQAGESISQAIAQIQEIQAMMK